MCCAHVQYSYLSDNQDFYGCASLAGIEQTNGIITDVYGY